MIYKTLSVKQPYATLICAGVKTVENRTWKTDYRGRLLIHASGDAWSWYDDGDDMQKTLNRFMDYYEVSNDFFTPPEEAPKNIQSLFRLNQCIFKHYHQPLISSSDIGSWIKDAVKKYGYFMPAQAIIGEATLADIVDNSDDDFAEPGQYHWIMSDPVLYEKPIINVLGHLRLWDFEKAA